MIVTLDRVKTEQKQIFKNLMSLYLHDLSEFDHSLDLNDELLIEFDVIDLFFKEDDLDVFYMRRENNVVGFILLKKGKYVNQEYADYILNSFFVIRKYRRQGIGLSAVQKLFEDYPGNMQLDSLSVIS